MDILKNVASIILGVFLLGLGVYSLFYWNVPWYAFVIPLILFIAGAAFGGAGLSGMD